ncbi:PLAC8 family-domain-containing protein [Crassisporium funariophilum]|nr:PLAC8 family-domain-containing protein [Crassisporium funariophilum]
MHIKAGGGNRNVKGLAMSKYGREWSHDLCGCCGSLGTCKLHCFAYFCPGMVFSKVKKRLDHLNEKGYAEPNNGGDGCSSECLMFHCGKAIIQQIALRGAVRARYNIEGGGCGDCFTVTCCGACALTQNSREIELEEQSMGVLRQ